MKLKITTTGWDAKVKAINEFIKSAIGRKVLDNLGQFAIDRIYKRVKSGKGVSDDSSNRPSETPLLELSKPYINKRKSLKLGESGTPRKSNLTLTGQMLNNLSYSLKEKGLKIFIKNTSRSDSKSSNSEIAKYVSKDRPFLALTDKEQDRLKQEFLKEIRLLARKLNSLLTRR